MRGGNLGYVVDFAVGIWRIRLSYWSNPTPKFEIWFGSLDKKISFFPINKNSLIIKLDTVKWAKTQTPKETLKTVLLSPPSKEG